MADATVDITPEFDAGASPSDARRSLPAAPWWYCSADPSASRVDDAGVTQWWWYFHWRAEDLAAVCASYGARAKMVLEVDYPKKTDVEPSELDCTTGEVVSETTRTCAIQGAYRFEADCVAGEMLFELPSQYTFHGWHHIEGALVFETKRSLVDQGVECPRSVFTMGYVPAAPGLQDAGMPTLDAPSQSKGCCPGDSGFGPLDSYSCPWDGGLSYPDGP